MTHDPLKDALPTELQHRGTLSLISHHDREQYRSLLGVLDDPEEDEEAKLDPGEEVDPGYRHPAQVGMVRLVLVGHEEEHEPVGELDALEDVDAHVEEDPVEHRQRDVAENRRQEDRDPDHHEGQGSSQSLLPENKHGEEIRMLYLT